MSETDTEDALRGLIEHWREKAGDGTDPWDYEGQAFLYCADGLEEILEEGGSDE